MDFDADGNLLVANWGSGYIEVSHMNALLSFLTSDSQHANVTIGFWPIRWPATHSHCSPFQESKQSTFQTRVEQGLCHRTWLAWPVAVLLDNYWRQTVLWETGQTFWTRSHCRVKWRDWSLANVNYLLSLRHLNCLQWHVASRHISNPRHCDIHPCLCDMVRSLVKLCTISILSWEFWLLSSSYDLH